MEKKPFQYSLFGLLVLTTACALLLSLAKTFPNAALRITQISLGMLGPLLVVLGSVLILRPFRHRTRFIRVYAPVAGLVCMIVGLLLCGLWHG